MYKVKSRVSGSFAGKGVGLGIECQVRDEHCECLEVRRSMVCLKDGEVECD